MKKTRLIVIAACGLLIIALAVIGANTLLRSPEEAVADTVYAAENDNASDNTGEISVSGAGSVNVNPDVAYVALGVTTKNADPKVALDENNQLIASVIDAVKGLGIVEKDIRTTDFNMYPDYNYAYEKGENQVTGYTVYNNVSVVVRDVSIVGEVLGTAANAGANISGGVQFGLLDNSSAYNEALVLAIQNASGKADAVAGALGKTVSSPSLVTESVNYYSAYSATAQNLAMEAAAGDVPIQTGKLTVTANVQMTYKYSL